HQNRAVREKEPRPQRQPRRRPPHPKAPPRLTSKARVVIRNPHDLCRVRLACLWQGSAFRLVSGTASFALPPSFQNGNARSSSAQCLQVQTLKPDATAGKHAKSALVVENKRLAFRSGAKERAKRAKERYVRWDWRGGAAMNTTDVNVDLNY